MTIIVVMSLLGMLTSTWASYLAGRDAPVLIPTPWSPPSDLTPEDRAWVTRHLALCGEELDVPVQRALTSTPYTPIRLRPDPARYSDGNERPVESAYSKSLRARAESFGSLRTQNTGPPVIRKIVSNESRDPGRPEY